MNDFRLTLQVNCVKYLAYSNDKDYAVGGGIFQEEGDNPCSTVHFRFRTEEQLDNFIADAKKMFRKWKSS